jgi:hypothetical protein
MACNLRPWPVPAARRCLALLAAAAATGVSGCAAGIAASAVGLAARSAQGTPASNAHLRPQAREACSAHAGQYGAVHVIDVEQRNASRIIVWGTVTDAARKRSFQCDFRTAITSFRLRPIRAAN